MNQVIGIFLLVTAASRVWAQPDIESVAAELWRLGLADTKGTSYCLAEFRSGSYRHKANAWCDPGVKTAVNSQGLRVPIERNLGPALLDDSYRTSSLCWALRVVMHWRAGQTAEAEAVYARNAGASPIKPWREAAVSQMATEIHIRAVAAHASGNAAEAFALSRRIQPLRDRFRDLAKIDLLVADSERRMRRGPRPPFDPALAGVPELIEHLDEVDAQQMSVPGGVDTLAHPITARLFSFGDQAMDALVAAVDEESRLTRSCTVARGRRAAGSIIPVREAIWDLAEELVRARAFVAPKRPGALRAWWDQNRHKTPAYRLLAILADDGAGEQAWKSAMRSLLGPERQTFRLSDGRRYALNETPDQLLVASLRSDPDFPRIVAERAVQTMAHSEHADWLGAQLMQWKADAGARALREAGARPFQTALLRPVQPSEISGLHKQAVAMARTWWIAYQQRPPAERPAVAAGYLKMLREIPDKVVEQCLVALAEPVLRNPADPLLAEVAAWLMERAKAEDLLEKNASSPLLLLPAFREAVRREIQNEQPARTVQVSPGLGETMVRRCDRIAARLYWMTDRDGIRGFRFSDEQLARIRHGLDAIPMTHSVRFKVDGPHLSGKDSGNYN